MAFDIDEGNYTNKELLPQLKELVLTDLPLMKYLWRQEPTILVFKNLVFLELVRCNNLKTLFSISVAKSHGQLELLKLYDWKDMEHVLESDAGRAKAVEFRKLKRLTLEHLRSLISFCKVDCDFKLSELVTVRVKNIPKMETFANETHQTPKLKEFYITYVSNCWQRDLNKTIKCLHDNSGGDYEGYKLLVKATDSSHALTNKSFTELESAETSVQAKNSEGPRSAKAEAVVESKETTVELSTAVGDEFPAAPMLSDNDFA